jgi:hypothetical protein
MLITSRPRRNTLIDIPNITCTSCIKYLGVYIDKHLQWHNQITHVNSKIAKNIGILFQLRRYLNIHMLTNHYYTLIYPYLSYGLMSWGSTRTTMANFHLSFLLLNYGRLYPFSLNRSLLILSKRI